MSKSEKRLVYILAFVFFVLPTIVLSISLYTDWLFFIETGYEAVLIKTISLKITSAVIFSLIFLVFSSLNIFIANRINFPQRDYYTIENILQPIKIWAFERFIKPLSFVAVIVLTLIVAQWGAVKWEQFALFINGIDMGITEPILKNDLGFYIFSLPFIETLRGFIGFTIVITSIIVFLNYLFRGGIIITQGFLSMEKRARLHIFILLGLVIVFVASGFYIDRFNILLKSDTVVSGAGYTDVNVRLPVLTLLTFITPILGFLSLYGFSRGLVRYMTFPLFIFAGLYVLGIMIIPSAVQKLKVAPNELALEMPYIENSIKFTRKAYDLDRIEVIPFDVEYNLKGSDIDRNEATIKNIRLWDHSPLLRTYSQLQQIRTYYRFADVDNDRYIIDGKYMQVMLSPRELSYNDLPSKSWINERLIFTHGNGITLGPVSRISREGLPEFIIKDIPPVSNADIKITRPEIYYGELSNEYVIVRTKVPEFSYPTSTENVYTTYNGKGGVAIDSIMRRILFSLRFQTEKILLSTDITDKSRILYYRNVLVRAKKLAPFLIFDKDPYIVINKDGRLLWMIDAYTTTNKIPYSKSINKNVNYIRNSVKVVIDAYDGTVLYYISDPSDVMIKVYSKIFPEIFRPLKEMPKDLLEHIRYPQMLLQAQAQMYSAYHMTDAKVFYNKENLWDIPSFGDKQMEPYYTIMKLPGEKKEEYILLLPYVPAKRDNLAAWLAARCDGDKYGRLIVYTFPRDRLVYGPKQVDARINQDAYISQQLTLWGQRGSQVIRGSLLVIPIERSLLYVQPLYLSAADKVGLPELRRVIVSYENEVVMEEDLESALVRLFGAKRQPSTKPQPEQKETRMSISELSKEALRLYERAIELQRQGNWAGYGEEIKKLEQVLRKMAR